MTKKTCKQLCHNTQQSSNTAHGRTETGSIKETFKEKQEDGHYWSENQEIEFYFFYFYFLHQEKMKNSLLLQSRTKAWIRYYLEWAFWLSGICSLWW